MTREDVLAMSTWKPGREMDVAVARATGWTHIVQVGRIGGGYMGVPRERPRTESVSVPHYSTDMAAAMEAAEELCNRKGWGFSIRRVPAWRYVASIGMYDSPSCATLSEAVCKAILLACGGETREGDG